MTTREGRPNTNVGAAHKPEGDPEKVATDSTGSIEHARECKTDDLAAMRRRREASQRLPRLQSGRRDPLFGGGR